MRTSLILTLFFYLVDISVLAVKDGDVGIGLSPELKSEIDSYVARVVSAITEKYENRITNLETELELQKRRISVLEAKEHFYESIFANEPTESGNVKGDQQATEDHETDGVISSELSHQERDVYPRPKWPQRDFHRIRRDVEPQVAFFASITTDLHNLGVNQDIVFDQVVTNIGNAYNGLHGTFVAPVAGTYFFSVTLNSETEPTYAKVFVNDTDIASLRVYNGQQSQTVIVKLQLEDDVSVRNYESLRGIGGEGYSTFCGFLLYADAQIDD